MDDQSLYETDFYSWTQRQSALLRDVRDNRLDTEHLAEEVADLGRSELNAVKSHIRQLFRHLLKLAVSPAQYPSGHWLSEVGEHADCARDAFSPGMRQHIDIDALWHRAVTLANIDLAEFGEPEVPEDLPCPLSLDDALAKEFDPNAALDTVRRAIGAT